MDKNLTGIGNYSNSVNFFPQKRIDNVKGDLLHIMKRSDEGYVDFGEAYFTTVKYKVIKGWKKHTKMFLNLTVPVGTVKFYVRNNNGKNLRTFEIGPTNYGRLFIPPGYWVAFEGGEQAMNLVLNLASIEHDPEEAINEPITTFPIG